MTDKKKYIRTTSFKSGGWSYLHPTSLRGFNCRCVFPPIKTAFTIMLEGVFKDLSEQGYHEDVIERCKFAINSVEGLEVFGNLPLKWNYEDFVQAMLNVYKSITS